MPVVRVRLAERSYSILIGEGLLHNLGAECDRLQLGQRCAVISDTKVAPIYGQAAMASLANAGFIPFLVTVPTGETAKSLRNVQTCYDQLARHRLERRSFIVALGGGVVGDLAGFVAATYLRGIHFVQVPTTLLAQVDSSVGGKVGVNLKAGKNLVGAFYQPRLVLCDLITMKSLPVRQFRSGMAEVIKYGLIYDQALFRKLEREMPRLLALDPQILGQVVSRCCEIKAKVVSQDERETGVRAILNFGHTIGHAIEAISGYGAYLHGEAISIGQVAAAQLSHLQLGLPALEVERVRNLFTRTGLPITIDLDARQWKKLLSAMRLDKKVRDGEIKFVLLPKIGKAVWGQKVTMERIKQAVSAPRESRGKRAARGRTAVQGN